MNVCLHINVSVIKERCFIGSRSNNQTDQEYKREGLDMEELEREGLKGLFFVLAYPK